MKTRLEITKLPDKADLFKVADKLKTFIGIYSAAVIDSSSIVVYYDNKKTTENIVKKEVALLTSRRSSGERLKRIIHGTE